MDTITGLQRLQAAPTTVFTANDLRLLFGVKNAASLHTTLYRLVARGILRRIGKGLFVLAGAAVDPFQLANLLRRPSYISLESALNLHGLLLQTPRTMTSVTTGRPCQLRAGDQEFSYRHLTPRLWFGFERNGTFLVATPEKAFFDWLYLSSRGDRLERLSDLERKRLNRKQMDAWAASVPSRSFQKAYRQWLRLKGAAGC